MNEQQALEKLQEIVKSLDGGEIGFDHNPTKYAFGSGKRWEIDETATRHFVTKQGAYLKYTTRYTQSEDRQYAPTYVKLLEIVEGDLRGLWDQTPKLGEIE